MASTTWTATREELVRELARARGERDAAIARAQAATLELQLRKAARADRTAEARARARAADEAEAIRWTAEARRLLNEGHIPPDPHAPAHRKTLADALKGRP